MNTVQITPILDGQVVAFHVYMESDGVSGDLTNYTVVDPVTDLNPPMKVGRDLTVEKIIYELSGFSIKFAFDGGAEGPWPFWQIDSGANAGVFDFSGFGNLPDRSGGLDGLDATGKILMTTTGFNLASSRGAFILQMRRANRG